MTDVRDFPRIAFAMIAVIYLGFTLPLIPVAADDLRMANVFSIDESDIGIEVWNLYRVGWSRPPSFKYGGVFYYIPMAALQILGIFTPVTEKVTLIVLRLFCTLSGAGCLVMTFALGRLTFNRQTGAFAALLLLATPTFLRWAVETHPDLPQLFFLLCSLYAGCLLARQFTLVRTAFAGLFAGLAFSTKYAGVFLLPVLLIALFVHWNYRCVWTHLRQGRRWWGIGVVLGAFVLAFALTSPFSVIYLPSFWESIQAEKEIMAFGHRVQAAIAPMAWIYALVSQVGIMHCVVLSGGAVLAIWHKEVLRSERMVLLAWIAFFLAYLMLEANLKRARHLLPILPCTLIMVGAAYVYLQTWLRNRFGRSRRWLWLAPLLVVVFSWENGRTSAALFNDRWTRIDGRVEIDAGRWLAETFDDETSIIFDAYAYVPSRFGNVYRSMGMSYLLVNHFEPDLLVVRDAIVADYADLSEANTSRMGSRDFKDRHFFYSYLQANRIPGYRLARDFGSVAIYERTVPQVRSQDDPRKRWRDLVRKERAKRRYGQVEALWTVGYLNLEDGLTEDANRMFARAKEMTNFIPRVYKHGVRLLASGHRAAAGHAFDAAKAAATGESIAYQAGMREDLAFRYFQARMFDAAAETAQEGLSLVENLPVAAFELATARLAAGDPSGVRLFDDAVERFGPHPKGLQLLKLVIHIGKAKGSAQNLMRRHYGEER